MKRLKSIKPFSKAKHLNTVQNIPRDPFLIIDRICEREGKENAKYFGTKFDNDACN